MKKSCWEVWAINGIVGIVSQEAHQEPHPVCGSYVRFPVDNPDLAVHGAVLARPQASSAFKKLPY